MNSNTTKSSGNSQPIGVFDSGIGGLERALRSLDPNLQVSACACPLLVPLIEEGWLQSAITDEIIMQYVGPLVEDGIDTLVLGCTHYPLLREAIARLLGDRITLV